MLKIKRNRKRNLKRKSEKKKLDELDELDNDLIIILKKDQPVFDVEEICVEVVDFEELDNEISEKYIINIIKDYKKEIDTLKKEWEEEFSECENYGWGTLSCSHTDSFRSEEFIREYYNHFNWTGLSACHTLSEDLIRYAQHLVDWDWIVRRQNFSEDFIREFQDKFNWSKLSRFKRLSEDLMREFQDKVNWYRISKYQNLSEDFIREFQDKVNWYRISRWQKLSEDFMREFQYKNKDIIEDSEEEEEYF